MRASRLSSAVLLAALATAAPAHAAFHFMKIVEVYPGSAAIPTSQYVILQMYSGGQNLVSGHTIQVFNAAGTVVGTYTFPGHVSNGANQARILIATAAAATEFGIAADLAMTSTIPATGGKVCFDAIDCVTWGNYTGAGPVGTPAAPAGIPSGQALVRDLGDGVLQSSDDTNDSASDFDVLRPAPLNNAGDGCGDGNLDPTEQCDDGNTLGGDACIRCEASLVSIGYGPASGLTSLLVSPNPFRSDAALHLTLPRSGNVEVGVYDVAGRRVRVLRASLPAGAHRITWDGRDDSGRAVGAGFYVVRARSEAFLSSARLLRVR